MNRKQPQPKAPTRKGPRPASPITFHFPKSSTPPPLDIDQWPVLWPLTEEDLRMPFGEPSWLPPEYDGSPPASG